MVREKLKNENLMKELQQSKKSLAVVSVVLNKYDLRRQNAEKKILTACRKIRRILISTW